MSSSRLQGFPPVYWLTLPGETARQQSILEQFEEYGITQHTQIDGFDGRLEDYKTKEGITGDFFYNMSSADIACTLGHLKMIRTWLETSDTYHAVFMEDDVNLRNCDNWNFTWREFLELVPAEIQCVQMALIKAEEITQVCFRQRVPADWSVTAYLMTRPFAERLIRHYFSEDGKRCHLTVPGDPTSIPIVENIIYFPGITYCIPLFTEKNTFTSSFYAASEKKVKTYNAESEKWVRDLWNGPAKTLTAKQIMDTTPEEKAIPMIGTAVVKNPHWVRRLVQSVDFPVKEFCIINNNGKGEVDAELDEIARTPHQFIRKIRVVHMPSNMGVSTSWNLMIKAYMKCPYWVIVNDDVAFGPGFLEEMYIATTRDPSVGVIHGYHGDFNVGSWDLFLIRDHVIAEYGLFDENLYPAYNEDADYIMRFMHRQPKRIMSLNSEYYHGLGKKNEYHIHGSQTGKTDPALRQKLDEANWMNIEYLTGKWGPGWRYCSPTPTPFSGANSGYPITYTTYDLRFVRKKHLGF